jgi:hypothetical protein
MNNYHVTTTGEGLDLEQQEAKATTQNMIVMGIFVTNRRLLTANDVHTIWTQRQTDIKAGTPILTSVRRALSNLKEDGYLEKKTAAKQGPYGVPVHYYELTPAGLKYALSLVPYLGKLTEGISEQMATQDPQQLSLF